MNFTHYRSTMLFGEVDALCCGHTPERLSTVCPNNSIFGRFIILRDKVNMGYRNIPSNINLTSAHITHTSDAAVVGEARI